MDADLKITQSFPVFRALGAPRKGPLDRFLSVFADVRAGEGASALLLALTAFLLLSGYYLLKTVREALILTEGGAVTKSYSAAAQALILLALVPAYGAFASRVNRKALITWVTLFFISHMVLFYVFGHAGAREGVVFFIWVGIFNVLVPAQFWSFANDIYTESQGKRLFPIIGAGYSIGALAGAQAASRLIQPLGAYSLMLVAAATVGSTILLLRYVHAREAAKPVTRQREMAEKPLGREGGFELVFRDRYLLLIAILIVLLNVVNTTGEFILGSFVTSAAEQAAGAGPEAREARAAFIGQFYGQFFTWVNFLSAVLQMFAVSRIFHYIGVRGALFILPLIAMGGYALLIAVPVLALIRTVKILENSMDYSVQNTARHALFLVTSREAKYKAKAAIDAFFMRAGDVLQAVVVFLGTQIFSLSVSSFAAVNLVLTGVWLVVVFLLYREHKRRTAKVAAAAA